MIITYKCAFGQPLALYLADSFGASVEIQALEFVNALPLEWRLVAEDEPLTPWKPGMPERKKFAFHDLQRSNGSGTSGTPGRDAVLETRGIGDGTVLVWLRSHLCDAASWRVGSFSKKH
jgi:hypothetical protein